MIYDGHAYCFPDLRGSAGFENASQFRKHLQLGIARHFQPVWESITRVPSDDSGLAKPDGRWDFDSLKEGQFRAAGFGRFEWTVNNKDYVKQYMPPSVTNMDYSASALVAEMDYAGVDVAMLHRTPYLGIGNDFIADCCRQFPGRLQGLVHTEEWLIRPEIDKSISKLDHAINTQGLHGIQFLPDHLTLYGQSEDWCDEEFTPYWDAVSTLGVPLFITPSYSSLQAKGAPVDGIVGQLQMIEGWMERYPDMTVVLTHGLSWRLFIEGNTLNIPDAIYDAIPSNPRFYLQLLFAIFLGGIWDYPMIEIRPTVEKIVEKIGVERLLWGTDIPMVMRFYTYKQNLNHMRICSDFLPDDQVDLIVGGNMARIMKM